MGKPGPEYDEDHNCLYAYTLMHVEGQCFDAQKSQLYASDVSWAPQDVSMPMVSMQDYVPDRMGGSSRWKDQQYPLPQHRQSGNLVTPLTASATSKLQTFGKYTSMGTSLCNIVPSNAYGLRDGNTATPRKTPGNSDPWQHTITNSKEGVAVTVKDNKTGILACSSPSLSQKNHIYQSSTKPEAAKTGDRTTHNDIERRYRTNLKSCFAELKAAIPALSEQQDGRSDGTANHATLKASKVAVIHFRY
jgi:hypothetical protein